MNRAFVVVTILLLAGSPSFAGKGNSFLGKEAPEIEADDWLNRPERTTVAGHRGEVLILEFFATWCGPCRGSIPHLSQLYEKYGDRGLNVIALSNESRLQVERYASQVELRLAYPVTIKARNPYGVTAIPHAYLIDVEGKVVWEGSPASLSESLVEKELSKVRRWSSVEGRRAAKAGKLLDKGEYGKAMAEAGKLLEAERTSEADRKSAEALAGQVRVVGERRLAWAEALVEEGSVGRAVSILEGVAASFAKTEWGDRAETRLKELEADPEAQALLEAGAAVRKLLSRVKTPLGERERNAVASALSKLMKKVEGRAQEFLEHWMEIMKEEWVAKRS